MDHVNGAMISLYFKLSCITAKMSNGDVAKIITKAANFQLSPFDGIETQPSANLQKMTVRSADIRNK